MNVVAMASRSAIQVDQTRLISPIHEMLSTIHRAESELDVRRANHILNHESVFPHVNNGMEGPLDLTPIVEDRTNALLLGEHGYMLFTSSPVLGIEMFEIHTAVLPSGRGPWAKRFAHACLHWMFVNSAAVEMMTRCPHLSNHRSTTRLAASCGMQFDFTSPAGYVGPDGSRVACDIYTISLPQWVRTAPGLVERGRWFHDKLEADFARLGHHEPNHPDDIGHDRHVGACAEMVFSGSVARGLSIYNRFVALSEYAPIRVINEKPLLLDIGSAYILVRGDDFYVHSMKDVARRQEH